MPLQAILLSITILLSVLLTQHKGIDKSVPQATSPSSPSFAADLSSFTNELSRNLSERINSFSKIVFAEADRGERKIADFSLASVEAGREFTKNQTQIMSSNLSVAGQILKARINKFFENLAKENVPLPAAANLNQFASQTYEKSQGEAATGILNTSSECLKNNFPILSAKAFIVKYLDHNLTVLELNPDKRWPIASLTKMMTSIITLEAISSEAKVNLSEKAVNTEGTAGNFKRGEMFKSYDLVKAMMVASSNNAAVALAEFLGEQEFINEMQRKANDLKMYNTTYLEPTGLSFINQSTVGDLVKLVNYIYQNHPDIFLISRQKEAELAELKSGEVRKVGTVNQFAGEVDFLGGKTGYIDEAGRNLVALFDINGQRVLFIVLGAEDAFKEVGDLKKTVQECGSR